MPAPYEPRKLAEIAADYEISGDSMRDVAERHDVSLATVHRAVDMERRADGQFETRRAFDLQRHVVDVLIESAELHQKLIRIANKRVDDPDFIIKQSGRDLAALIGTLAKEDRAWFEYMRRTFGDRANEPPDAPDTTDPPEQYEQ